MQKIQMVDLSTQYQKIKTEVDAAIQTVIDATAFINGPEVKLFESELAHWLGNGQVVACANGTDALQIALMGLDLKPDSEILVPAFNYVATAEVIGLLGFKPVFVEVKADTYGIDVEKLEQYLTPNTQAIMPVHLFGQCCDMEGVLDFAKKHNLKVIEDIAQSIGAKYTFSNGTTSVSGVMGHIATTSFFPSKNLGCYGDGGAIITNDLDLAATVRSIANHGQRSKYVYERIGVNSRLDTIQAAILRIKLKSLNNYVAERQKAAAYYDAELVKIEGITVPFRDSKSTHQFHQYTIQVADGKRNSLKDYLQSVGIPTMVYYPGALHLQQAYAYLGYKPNSIPVAESLCEKVLSLPMHTELSTEQLEFIVKHIKTFMQA